VDPITPDSTKRSAIASLRSTESHKTTVFLRVGPPSAGRGHARFRKSAKSCHAKSHYRDAECMRRMRQLALEEDLGGAPFCLVREDRQRTISRLPLVLDTTDGRMKPAMNRIPRRWYDKFSSPPAKSHRVTALWRDATPRLRGEFAHYELYRHGDVYAMSANLSAEIETAALREGERAKRYLAKRISYHLCSALGRTSQFWFVLEETPERRLHLHGAISCNGNELGAVSRALQAAGGKWEASGRQFQVCLKPDPDNYWVTYAFKGCGVRTLRRFHPSWRDDPLFVTQDLKRRSEALYEETRKQVTLCGRGLRAARGSLC
jgi:hypothetical protein